MDHVLILGPISSHVLMSSVTATISTVIAHNFRGRGEGQEKPYYAGENVKKCVLSKKIIWHFMLKLSNVG